MKDRLRRFFEIQDEINFKELFTNPARLFGYSYFYILIVLTGLGIYFVKNLPEMNKNSIPPFVIADTLNSNDLAFSLPVDIPPVDVFQLSQPTPQLVEKGKAFYNSNCSSCHGDQGKGDGPAGQMMNPKPRNFTSSEGWINGRKISDIYKTLHEGIIKSGMPSYNHINPEELFAVIQYIRTFANDYPVDSKDDLQALNDMYKLSEGKKSSGQIPTSKALFLILTENSSTKTTYEKIVERLKNDSKYDDLILSNEKLAGALVNFMNSSQNVSDLNQILSSDPVLYGLSPKFLLMSETEKKNFYNYLLSFIGKKEEKL
jgi:mono/diheme cytochrome c family protein